MKVITRAYTHRLRRSRVTRLGPPPDTRIVWPDADPTLGARPRIVSRRTWRLRWWLLRVRWARFLDRVLGEPAP